MVTGILPCVLSFPTGINYGFVRKMGSHGASITWNDRIVSVTASEEADSVALMECIMPIHLNHLEVTTVSMNAKFAPPDAMVNQFIGMGDSASGLFIGFKGTEFGLQLLHDGSKTFWKLMITQGCSVSGSITITLIDQVIQIPVIAGMTPWQIMLSIYQSALLRDNNMRTSIECDGIEIYSIFAIDLDDITTREAIDFGSTGILGTLVCSLAGYAAEEIWIPMSAFNETSESLVHEIVFTKMNVYQFYFSRWSSGGIRIEIMNPYNLFMTPIHTFVPTEKLFDTIIPYRPNVRVIKTGVTATPITIEHSQGVVNSGIPTTAGFKARFSRHFCATDLSLTVGTKTTFGIISNPIVQSGVQNFMIASLIECHFSVTCSEPILIRFGIGYICEGEVVCSRHLPWSCVNVSSNDINAHAVVDGIEYGNLVIATSNEYFREFEQGWLVPGLVFTLLAEPIGAASASATINACMSWYEC